MAVTTQSYDPNNPVSGGPAKSVRDFVPGRESSRPNIDTSPSLPRGSPAPSDPQEQVRVLKPNTNVPYRIDPSSNTLYIPRQAQEGLSLEVIDSLKAQAASSGYKFAFEDNVTADQLKVGGGLYSQSFPTYKGPTMELKPYERIRAETDAGIIQSMVNNPDERVNINQDYQRVLQGQARELREQDQSRVITKSEPGYVTPTGQSSRGFISAVDETGENRVYAPHELRLDSSQDVAAASASSTSSTPNEHIEIPLSKTQYQAQGQLDNQFQQQSYLGDGRQALNKQFMPYSYLNYASFLGESKQNTQGMQKEQTLTNTQLSDPIDKRGSSYLGDGSQGLNTFPITFNQPGEPVTQTELQLKARKALETSHKVHTLWGLAAPNDDDWKSVPGFGKNVLKGAAAGTGGFVLGGIYDISAATKLTLEGAIKSPDESKSALKGTPSKVVENIINLPSSLVEQAKTNPAYLIGGVIPAIISLRPTTLTSKASTLSKTGSAVDDAASLLSKEKVGDIKVAGVSNTKTEVNIIDNKAYVTQKGDVVGFGSRDQLLAAAEKGGQPMRLADDAHRPGFGAVNPLLMQQNQYMIRLGSFEAQSVGKAAPTKLRTGSKDITVHDIDTVNVIPHTDSGGTPGSIVLVKGDEFKGTQFEYTTFPKTKGAAVGTMLRFDPISGRSRYYFADTKTGLLQKEPIFSIDNPQGVLDEAGDLARSSDYSQIMREKSIIQTDTAATKMSAEKVKNSFENVMMGNEPNLPPINPNAVNRNFGANIVHTTKGTLISPDPMRRAGHLLTERFKMSAVGGSKKAPTSKIDASIDQAMGEKFVKTEPKVEFYKNTGKSTQKVATAADLEQKTLAAQQAAVEASLGKSKVKLAPPENPLSAPTQKVTLLPAENPYAPAGAKVVPAAPAAASFNQPQGVIEDEGQVMLVPDGSPSTVILPQQTSRVERLGTTDTRVQNIVTGSGVTLTAREMIQEPQKQTQDPELTLAQMSRAASMQTNRQSQIPGLRQVPVHAQAQRQVQQQRAVQRLGMVQRQVTGTPLPQRPVESSSPPRPPRIRLDEDDDSKKKSRNRELVGGYIPQVRIGGSFRNLTDKPLSKEEALALGVGAVSGSAAASLRLAPADRLVSGGQRVRNVDLSRFYASRKEPGVLIQQNRFRISSAGEKRDITYKGIEASRGRRFRDDFDSFSRMDQDQKGFGARPSGKKSFDVRDLL